MGGVPSRFAALFRRRDPETPVKGILPRIKNVVLNNYKGLIGFFVPLVVLSWQGKKGSHHLTVQCMWIMMFWFFLIQPVNIPVVGLIPIFLLPMTGVLSTVDACKFYMNDNIILFILTGMLILLLNNSGVDRRIALWLLCSGDNCQFAAKRMVFKCTTAGFFLSMFSSRLIVASTLTQYVTPPLMALHAANSGNNAEPNYNEMRYIICNSIQTACAIGGIAIPHAAAATLAFRAMFYESAPKGKEYPDIFNYFQYCVYAFPVAFLMHILNFAYHMILVNCCVGKAMSNANMVKMRQAMLKHKEDIPRRSTFHEKLSILFAFLYLLLFFLRWSKYLDKGWGDFRAEESSPEIPGLKDATVAAMFVIALHSLPKGYGFVKFFGADKKSQLPPIKPESSILFWRFVDKNVNYGYIFLIGGGVALTCAARDSGLGAELSADLGKKITDNPWNWSIFLVCFFAVLFANLMSGVAACVVWLPFVLNMSLAPDAPANWQVHNYLGALGVGVGSSLGFMFPFLFTPAYFCHYTGKVPKRRMAKYAFGSVIICLIVLWLSLCLWAPYVWDPNGHGIKWENAPVQAGEKAQATTPEGDAGGGGGGGDDDAGGGR